MKVYEEPIMHLIWYNKEDIICTSPIPDPDEGDIVPSITVS